MRLLFVFLLCSFGASAQNTLTGKTFIAPQGQTCKEMTDGGCMISYYRILEFDSDSVQISWIVEASCTPEKREANYEHMYDNLTQKYSWTTEKAVLRIEGSEEFDVLTINPDSISGMKNVAGAKEAIVFTEKRE